MDLTPLYELRERLRTGAIAGAALAAGDFRLARALEGLTPFEKASPVFERLGQLARQVLAPDCENRAVALLEAITLCDAVLCAQGAVAVPGELEELPRRSGGIPLTSAPYLLLASLMETLTAKDGKHRSRLKEAYEAHPELLWDYRVQQALVKALDSKSWEFAYMVRQWLEEGDEGLLPFLLEDFQPAAGTRAMAWRVKVMDVLAGGKLNDWYLEQLKKAKKQVRPPLIYALRHRQENLEVLLALEKKEKGDNRKAVLQALAHMDTPDALASWRELAKENPAEAVDYSRNIANANAATLTAELFLGELEAAADPSNKLDPEQLGRLLNALIRKTGPAICQVYRKGAAQAPSLDLCRSWVNGTRKIQFKQEYTLWEVAFQGGQCFSAALAEVLTQSIYQDADPMLCSLAEELYEEYGGIWAAPVVCAALLTKGAEEAAAVGKKLLTPDLLKELKRRGEKKLLMELVFGRLIGPRGDYDNIDDEKPERISYRGLNEHYTPIAAPLDSWWYQLMMDLQMDKKLWSLLQKEEPACQQVLEYFYHRLWRGESVMLVRNTFQLLDDCGWTNWKGLLLSFMQNDKVHHINYDIVVDLLEERHISNRERAEELAEIHAALGSKRNSPYFPVSVEEQIQEWMQG